MTNWELLLPKAMDNPSPGSINLIGHHDIMEDKLMNYTIDRFEGEFALCEDESGALVSIPARELPPEAKEGDILSEENGRYTCNTEETRKRREMMRKRLEGLFG